MERLRDLICFVVVASFVTTCAFFRGTSVPKRRDKAKAAFVGDQKDATEYNVMLHVVHRAMVAALTTTFQ